MSFVVLPQVWRKEFRGDFAEGAKKQRWSGGEGTRKLTESARKFPKTSAPPDRLSRTGGAEASNSSRQTLLFLRLQQLLPLLEHGENRLRGTGVQAEATAFQATGRVELVRRS